MYAQDVTFISQGLKYFQVCLSVLFFITCWAHLSDAVLNLYHLGRGTNCCISQHADLLRGWYAYIIGYLSMKKFFVYFKCWYYIHMAVMCTVETVCAWQLGQDSLEEQWVPSAPAELLWCSCCAPVVLLWCSCGAPVQMLFQWFRRC